MSLATALAANAHTLDVTLFIEGVPIVFGTRAGLVHPMTDLDGNTLTNVGALTSVVGLKPDGISVGQSTLNWETLIMEPASSSFEIISSTTWDQYFKRRWVPTPAGENSYFANFLSSMTYAATTIDVDPSYMTAANFNGKMIYCERESMLVTGVASNTLTVTRAYCDFPGTQAAHQNGNEFSFSPPFWVGRRCEIRTWLGGSTLRVVYGVIQASPIFDKGKPCWKIETKDTMSMLDRKIAIGFTGGGATAAYQTGAVVGRPGLTITPTDDWLDEAGDTAEDNGHLLIVDANGASGLVPIYSISAGGVFTIYADNVTEQSHIAGSAVNNALDAYGTPPPGPNTEFIRFARRCYVLRGSPMVGLLNVMLSRTGNSFQTATVTGTEPIGDRLFGRTQDSSDASNRPAQWGTEKRFGASLHKLFLDVHSSLATTDMAIAAKEYVPGWFYALGLSGEESLLELMTEVALAHGGFWFLNYKGQISFRRFRADVPGFAPSGMQSFAVTDDHLSRDGTDFISLDDESEITPTQTLECNWDPIENKFMSTFNLVDLRVAETYREKANNLKQSRKGLYVHVPGQPVPRIAGMGVNAVHVEYLRTAMERVAVQRNRGLRKYNVRLPFTFAKMQPGDRVTLTSRHLIDFTEGLAAESASADRVGGDVYSMNCVALQVKVDPRGAYVDAQLAEKALARVIGPTLEVESYDAGTKIITLVNGAGLEWDDQNTARPTDFLPDVGSFSSEAIMLLLDASAAIPYGTITEMTPTTWTATTITLSAAPATLPAVGDLICVRALNPFLFNVGENTYGQTAADFAHATGYNSGATGKDWIDTTSYPGNLIEGATIYPAHRWG